MPIQMRKLCATLKFWCTRNTVFSQMSLTVMPVVSYLIHSNSDSCDALNCAQPPYTAQFKSPDGKMETVAVNK